MGGLTLPDGGALAPLQPPRGAAPAVYETEDRLMLRQSASPRVRKCVGNKRVNKNFDTSSNSIVGVVRGRRSFDSAESEPANQEASRSHVGRARLAWEHRRPSALRRRVARIALGPPRAGRSLGPDGTPFVACVPSTESMADRKRSTAF